MNVRLTTNASQQVTSSNQPDAFGISSVTAGTASAYAYGGAAGYREDGISPAGLSSNYAFQKVGARYYDQAFGAFLTRDTDLSQSPYAYCNGDPVNFVDADGHKAKTPPTIPTPTPTPPSSGTIPVGSTGGTVGPGPTPGSVTGTTPPVSVGSGGIITGTVSGGGGSPTTGTIDFSQPVAGGLLKVKTTYNFTSGSTSVTGSYNHGLGGGFSGGISFGTGEVPGFNLAYGF